MIELRQGDRQMERNSKIRATIKQMFENGEMGLTKLMRRMGALWTKTQAAKKARGQMFSMALFCMLQSAPFMDDKNHE